jgi:hypothetical protein
LLKRNLRFRPDYVRNSGIVSYVSAGACRNCSIFLDDAYAGNASDDVSEMVDGKGGGGTLYDRNRLRGLHGLVESGDAVINVTDSAQLFATSPNFDLGCLREFCLGNFATKRRRNALFAALPWRKRAENARDTDDTGFYSVVYARLKSETLH